MDIFGIKDFQRAVKDVGRDIAGDVHGIFGGAVRRGVRELESREVTHIHPHFDCYGEEVDTFVHTVDADGLRA